MNSAQRLLRTSQIQPKPNLILDLLRRGQGARGQLRPPAHHQHRVGPQSPPPSSGALSISETPATGW